jgi:uncharacterized membrane protein
MDTIMHWAKENFDLIILLVSMAGVVVAFLSLVYELKEKKKRKSKKLEGK